MTSIRPQREERFSEAHGLLLTQLRASNSFETEPYITQEVQAPCILVMPATPPVKAEVDRVIDEISFALEVPLVVESLARGRQPFRGPRSGLGSARFRRVVDATARALRPPAANVPQHLITFSPFVDFVLSILPITDTGTTWRGGRFRG